MLKPYKLVPALKNYIWGGSSLTEKYNIKSDYEKTAEAWVLSAHADGSSDFSDGRSFKEYINENPDAVGRKAQNFDNFPMLIKLIDACDNLSVQVHPDDAYALENEGEYGKTEMWYVADCTEDAFLYYGFNKDITEEEFSMRIKNNTVTEILNRVKVKKGDTFFISAGTVHAIGAGILYVKFSKIQILHIVFTTTTEGTKTETQENFILTKH